MQLSRYISVEVAECGCQVNENKKQTYVSKCPKAKAKSGGASQQGGGGAPSARARLLQEHWDGMKNGG